MQHDRFIFNWRKTSAEQGYSRYGAVVERFGSAFVGFTAFLRENGLAEAKLT